MAVNTKQQFSPNHSDELLRAVMENVCAHQSMSTQALDSESIQARLLSLCWVQSNFGRLSVQAADRSALPQHKARRYSEKV